MSLWYLTVSSEHVTYATQQALRRLRSQYKSTYVLSEDLIKVCSSCFWYFIIAVLHNVNIITQRLLKKFQNSSSLFIFSCKYKCDHKHIFAFLVPENVLQMGGVCRTQIYCLINWVLAQAGVPGWGLPARYSTRWPASLSKSEAGNLKKRARP